MQKPGYSFIFLGLMLFTASCKRPSCPADDRPFSGASAKIIPGNESIRLGESVRLEVIMPDMVRVDGDAAFRNLRRYPAKWAFVNIRNQRTNIWSGRISARAGRFEVVAAADSGSAQLHLAPSDSSSVASVAFTPADTGIYILHVDYLLVGDGCRTFTGMPGLVNGNRNLHLINLSQGLSADPAYVSKGYYFRVLP